ncbi:MAG TPA: hypothetical protein VFA49_05470 [Chloroflexota bacterium]|jgi:hypothetical protein|nr:hypothetical protein [Chloroflexota bacterium]
MLTDHRHAGLRGANPPEGSFQVEALLVILLVVFAVATFLLGKETLPLALLGAAAVLLAHHVVGDHLGIP